MGISMILGGSEPLPGWFGAVMQWKLKLKWAFACVKEGVKACQDALCTYVPSKRRFSKFAQIGPEKKCPRVPVWVRGGCDRYLGNARMEATTFSVVLPLVSTGKIHSPKRSYSWVSNLERIKFGTFSMNLYPYWLPGLPGQIDLAQ